MRMRTRVRLLWIAAMVVAAPAARAAEPGVIGAADVQALLARDRTAVVIDVRTADEYADAHLPRAINIPAAEVAASRARLPRDRKVPLVFYCRGVG